MNQLTLSKAHETANVTDKPRASHSTWQQQQQCRYGGCPETQAEAKRQQAQSGRGDLGIAPLSP